ncbi:hypothetical protein NQ315_003596 [Exocentrus adspersus]|uniref:Integrase zinc-binding domain-containing protein n=1 Tax=Exocentrus adspersus TaxID=1586481 RepID=A0AAV8VJB3_9CUCU|nr:hypothetical protein NQ315_003596 [Exocentrus adspersus]
MDHALLVNVRNTKNNVDRNFIINNSNKNGIDLIEVCRKYMALRKPETTHSKFFVRYEKSQCTVQAIGKNTFGKIPQKVAEYLNLPNSTLYTGHCFRRTSASLLADSGASIDVWKRHGGGNLLLLPKAYLDLGLEIVPNQQVRIKYLDASLIVGMSTSIYDLVIVSTLLTKFIFTQAFIPNIGTVASSTITNFTLYLTPFTVQGISSSELYSEFLFWALWDSLAIENNLLKRVWESPDGKERNYQTILPRKRVPEVLQAVHSGVGGGHFGINKTLDKVRERFYWLGSRSDVEEWCRRCATIT